MIMIWQEAAALRDRRNALSVGVITFCHTQSSITIKEQLSCIPTQLYLRGCYQREPP